MSKVNNGDMPASALFDRYGNCSYAKDDRGYTTTVINSGLTKREAFAMAAMQNILSHYNPYESGDFDSSEYNVTASHAVGLADALLKELEK